MADRLTYHQIIRDALARRALDPVTAILASLQNNGWLVRSADEVYGYERRIEKLETALREIADLPDVEADNRSVIARDALAN